MAAGFDASRGGGGLGSEVGGGTGASGAGGTAAAVVEDVPAVEGAEPAADASASLVGR